jgi:hypothetical protein
MFLARQNDLVLGDSIASSQLVLQVQVFRPQTEPALLLSSSRLRRCDFFSIAAFALSPSSSSMAFESGTAYPESDADDEYERSVHDSSPMLATDSEASPTDSEGPSSNEHTPTTYGAHSSGDRLPETIISEWTADECADFVSSLGLRQYGDQFLGTLRVFSIALATSAH